MIRRALPSETPSLVALAASTGLFTAVEADRLLRETLDEFHAGNLEEGHLACVATDDATGEPTGWVYFAPDANADRVWNLWWIGVAPARQGQGFGKGLLTFVEEHVQKARGRLLLIETSSLPNLERTREFYVKRGYSVCGQVPHFYADGDDKVIFAKRI